MLINNTKKMCCNVIHSGLNQADVYRYRRQTVRDLLQTATRCSAIAERPRCMVRYSFRQK